MVTCALCNQSVVVASNVLLTCSHAFHQLCYDAHVVVAASEGSGTNTCPTCGLEAVLIPHSQTDLDEVTLGSDSEWSEDEEATDSDLDFIAGDEEVEGCHSPGDEYSFDGLPEEEQEYDWNDGYDSDEVEILTEEEGDSDSEDSDEASGET